jgi:hypothetical protein
MFHERETLAARMGGSASVDMTHGTSPLETILIWINDTSVAYSYVAHRMQDAGSSDVDHMVGQSHQQKMILKFWSYLFSPLFCDARCNGEGCCWTIAIIIAVGNNSNFLWCVWHAMEYEDSLKSTSRVAARQTYTACMIGPRE